MDELGSTGTGAIAGVGVVAALLSSTCCVVPFALVSMGIGGAWMSNLTALAPYQPFFVLVAVVLIGAGFYARSRRRKKTFADDSYCATDRSDTVVSIILWSGVALTLLAVLFPWVVSIFVG